MALPEDWLERTKNYFIDQLTEEIAEFRYIDREEGNHLEENTRLAEIEQVKTFTTVDQFNFFMKNELDYSLEQMADTWLDIFED